MQACLQDVGFPFPCPAVPVPQEGRGCSALIVFSSREIFLFLSRPGPPGEAMGLIVAV